MSYSTEVSYRRADGDPDYWVDLGTIESFSSGPDNVIEQACEVIWHECDGWEWMPGCDAIVFRFNGKEHRAEVNVEFDPQFDVRVSS